MSPTAKSTNIPPPLRPARPADEIPDSADDEEYSSDIEDLPKQKVDDKPEPVPTSNSASNPAAPPLPNIATARPPEPASSVTVEDDASRPLNASPAASSFPALSTISHSMPVFEPPNSMPTQAPELQPVPETATASSASSASSIQTAPSKTTSNPLHPAAATEATTATPEIPPPLSPASTRLTTQITLLRSTLSSLQSELALSDTQLPSPENADAIVKAHIKLLHEYNAIKDVGLGLMGLIAEGRGVRLGEVMGEFGVGGGD